MGFLSKIGSALGGVFKMVAPIAASFIGGPLAGMATNLLTGIADKFIGDGKSFVDGLLQKIPLFGNPLSKLADSLIGKLQGGVDGGIASLVQNLAQSIVKRITGDGVSVAPPPLGSGTRGTGVSTASQVAGQVTGNSNFGQASSDSVLNDVSLPPKPGFPGANASDMDLLKYQEAMQKYNRMLTMITQILEMQHEGKKSVIQNLRA